MNKCLNCSKEVKNKYCNVSCQNKHLHASRTDKRYGKIINISLQCYTCNKTFNKTTREKSKLHTKNYCSRSCANTRVHSDETKLKIKNSLAKKPKKLKIIKLELPKNCVECNKEFFDKKKKCCSKECVKKRMIYGSNKGGRKSVEVQANTRRSKNEIIFHDKCVNYFGQENVDNNKAIFNGWDADVIIKNIKVAILWNGAWHYTKITHKHSVKQVQKRDEIKLKEIVICGYTPYVIKDEIRKGNISDIRREKYVDDKFNEFIIWLNGGLV